MSYANKGWGLTICWVFIFLILIINKTEDFQTLKLNEVGDFLAGFASVLAVIWFIVGYYQQGKEQKEQRILLERQIDLAQTRNIPRLIIQRLTRPEFNRDTNESMFTYRLSVFGDQINIIRIIKGDRSLKIEGINENTILYPNVHLDISIKLPTELDTNLRRIKFVYNSLSNDEYDKIFDIY